MQRLLSKIVKNIKNFYLKAEDLIEEERQFPLSQNLLNATIHTYVTENVTALEDLHAELYDEWCRLYATLDYKGIHATLSVDLRLIQMQIDKDIQQMVFEQISETQVIDATFSSSFRKFVFNIGVYFFQRVLNRDPLGMILEKLEVVEVKHDLLYLDLHKYLIKSDKAMRYLKKFNVAHAFIRNGDFVLKGNINLQEILKREEPSDDGIIDSSDYAELDVNDTKHSPTDQ